jgi:hypothetical protein
VSNLPPAQTWQTLYEEALAESDPEELLPLVMATAGAIFLRSQELKQVPGEQEERRAIDGALRVLRTLQVTKLNFPE